MLLRRVNKRHVILNNIFRSGEIERLHSLKFDSLRQDEKWRIAARGKESGGYGWTLLWVLGISVSILVAVFVLWSRV